MGSSVLICSSLVKTKTDNVVVVFINMMSGWLCPPTMNYISALPNMDMSCKSLCTNMEIHDWHQTDFQSMLIGRDRGQTLEHYLWQVWRKLRYIVVFPKLKYEILYIYVHCRSLPPQAHPGSRSQNSFCQVRLLTVEMSPINMEVETFFSPAI